MDKGFSLIELLVTTAMVGLLAGISVLSYQNYTGNAYRTQATVELASIRNAVHMLEFDTGLSPGGIAIDPCVEGTELYLDTCAAGLLCNDGRFSNWSGPYIDMPMTDPWDNIYLFDSDYFCNPNITGCTNTDVVRTISTAGPNGVFNDYDSGEAVIVLCG